MENVLQQSDAARKVKDSVSPRGETYFHGGKMVFPGDISKSVFNQGNTKVFGRKSTLGESKHSNNVSLDSQLSIEEKNMRFSFGNGRSQGFTKVSEGQWDGLDANSFSNRGFTHHEGVIHKLTVREGRI